MPHTPNTRLRALFAEADWDANQVARALGALDRERGGNTVLAASTVRRWLAGAQPRPPAPALLLECLSRRLNRPVTAQDAGLTHAPAAVVDPSWEADPLRKLFQLAHAEFDPDRRVLLGTGIFSSAALTLPAPAPGNPPDLATTDRDGTGGTDEADGPDGPDEPDETDLAGAGRPGRAEAERVRAMAGMFAAAAEQHGGAHVRPAVAAYLAQHVVPLLHASADGPAHRALESASAQLALVLGTLCADSGHDRAAQYYQQVAAQLAADVDDATTLAIALRTMTTHAYELGHRSSYVLQLAERAALHARHTAPAVQSYAYAHMAVLQAPHDRRSALALMTRAERLHARSDQQPGPFTAYPEGALAYQRGRMLAALGDHPGAARALAASLRLRGPTEHRAAALTRAHLAETLLNHGHLDRALAHWDVFLDVYPTLHSARAARRLKAMRRHLRPYQRHASARRILTRARFSG